MTLRQPSLSRLLPVRLSDIRDDVRCRAAREYPGDGAVLHAALFPSDETYWIETSAVHLLRAVVNPERKAA